MDGLTDLLLTLKKASVEDTANVFPMILEILSAWLLKGVHVEESPMKERRLILTVFRPMKVDLGITYS